MIAEFQRMGGRERGRSETGGWWHPRTVLLLVRVRIAHGCNSRGKKRRMGIAWLW